MFLRTALSFGIVVTATIGAQAADVIIPTAPQPIVESYAPGFDWTGFYVGANVGGQFTGAHSNGVVGALLGYNSTIIDSVIAGVEGRADYVFDGYDFSAGEYLALGRIGFLVTDSVLAYGAAGLGYRDTSNGGASEGGIYAFGAGAEIAATEYVSLRGEVLGIGFLGDGLNGNNAPAAAKATVGALFHF